MHNLMCKNNNTIKHTNIHYIFKCINIINLNININLTLCINIKCAVCVLHQYTPCKDDSVNIHKDSKSTYMRTHTHICIYTNIFAHTHMSLCKDTFLRKYEWNESKWRALRKYGSVSDVWTKIKSVCRRTLRVFRFPSAPALISQ